VEYRVDWIRVHTWSAESAYTLKVNEGVGSGPYVAGTMASITAKMPSAGQVFDTWVVDAGTVVIDNLIASSATLTMPASDVTVTATYRIGTSVLPRLTSKPGMSGKSREHPAIMYDIRGKKIAVTYSPLPAGVYIFVRKGQLTSKSISAPAHQFP